MRLTLEDNPESLKRYGHLRPARAGGLEQLCHDRCPGTRHRCSREKGHREPHVAFGLFRKVVAVWDKGAQEAMPSRAPSPAEKRSARRGPRRARRAPTLFARLRDFLGAPFSSFEELAWAMFFLVFVGFAVGGFLLIYLG
jgi:hypothetical protein